MLDDKEIDPKWLDIEQSRWSKIREWLDDRNPIPYSARRWLDDCDLLHPRRILQKLHNVARWIPVLWADSDWDYVHLYEVIKFKLGCMRGHFEEHDMHSERDEMVRQLRSAEDCLSRLIADDYDRELRDAHYARFPHKWGWIDLPNGMKQMAPMSDDERASFKAIWEAEEDSRQKDLGMFAEAFVEQSRGWWC